MTIDDYNWETTTLPPPVPTDAELELAQLRADIRLMNAIGNRQASAHGFCDAWEAIMRHINKRTNDRLGLVGRPGRDPGYELDEEGELHVSDQPDYHGVVLDLDAKRDYMVITLYYNDDTEADRFVHHSSLTEDVTDDDIVAALILVERIRPGVLNAALAAVRPADTHN